MNLSSTFKQGRSRAILAGVCSIVFAASLSAQVTSIKLPKADSSASFQVKDSGSVAKLLVNGDGGFVAGGTYGTGTMPATGPGIRMMWCPIKAAFRAGLAGSTGWDLANVGDMSVAMGYDCKATNAFSMAMGESSVASGSASTAIGYVVLANGNYSFATGYGDTASGANSTTMGAGTRADGQYSTATGYNAKANGTASTAMGHTTLASGMASTAMGHIDTASGIVSTAMGNMSKASGDYSTAIGYRATAGGTYSTAMGNNVSTAGYSGAFIIGDNSVATSSTAANQMTMRFAGGYNLFSNGTATVGVSLAVSGNSWATISDSTKKTNFQKADGDYFLQSLSKLRLGSWNYKAQDAKNYRHYGPMAQEIFHYFGHDAKGTIGCDTLLASADMDGIMMICLQALEKRTGELNNVVSKLDMANEKIAKLEQQASEQKTFEQKSIAALTEKIERLNQLVSAVSTTNKTQLTLNTSKGDCR